MAIGFAVTTLLGAGFGAGVIPYSASQLEPRALADSRASAAPDPSTVTIEEVSGGVSIRTASEGWRRIAEGQVLRRPLTIRTRGIDGYVRLFVKGTRMVIAQEALVHLGAAGRGFSFQVDDGLVLAYRDKQRARALVPLQQAEIKGQAFGVWVQPRRTIVSILEGETTIRYQGQKQSFSFNREVVLNRGVFTPAVLPSQLTVDVITKRKIDKQSRIAARTWPNSRVYAFGTEGFQQIELSRGGTFAIQVPGDMPAPGTLIALDAAGRWAELDQPSRRLEQVLHDLKTGRGLRSRPQQVNDDATVVRSPPPSAPPPPARPRPSSPADDEAKPPKRPAESAPRPPPPTDLEPPPLSDDDEDIDETAL